MSSKKGVRFSEKEPEVFEYEKIDLPDEEPKEKIRSQERKDWFLDVMSVSMGIRTPVQLLEEVTFEGIAKYIASGQCSNIMTMAGAGISTSAGIPDYRSPGTGLMDQLKDKYPNVKHVTDLFNIQTFLKDPKPFYDRSKRFFEVSLKPTPCHYFVRLLHEKGLLLRHYTQNIDTLERLAGIPGEQVVEAHGSYFTSHCMLCDAQYSFDWMEKKVLQDHIPICEEKDCDGVIKPDIVMYGESLNDRFKELADGDTLKCDLLIVMGTALAVQPFASLTGQVKTSTPRLYINLDRGQTNKKHPMTDLMFGGSFDFDCEDNIRDIHKEDKCDEACYELADLIGWGDELRALVKAEHERIDEEDRLKGKTKPPPLNDDTATTPPLPPPPQEETTPATTTTTATVTTNNNHNHQTSTTTTTTKTKDAPPTSKTASRSPRSTSVKPAAKKSNAKTNKDTAAKRSSGGVGGVSGGGVGGGGGGSTKQHSGASGSVPAGKSGVSAGSGSGAGSKVSASAAGVSAAGAAASGGSSSGGGGSGGGGKGKGVKMVSGGGGGGVKVKSGAGK